MKFLFALFLFFSPVVNVVAMEAPQQAANCHCFKERTFDPQKKFAADSYLLVTSFNSFIAANFHISKRQIVMMKMEGGADPDDLLVALYVARGQQIDHNTILTALKNGGSWQQILNSESIRQSSETEKTFRSIAQAGDDKKLGAEIVTDQLVKEYFGVSETLIAALRKEGATGREMVLVLLLEQHGKTKKTALDIMKMYSGQKKSWGEIAQGFGLTPKETGQLLGQNKSVP